MSVVLCPEKRAHFPFVLSNRAPEIFTLLTVAVSGLSFFLLSDNFRIYRKPRESRTKRDLPADANKVDI